MKPAIFVTATLTEEARDVLKGFEVFEGEAADLALAKSRVLMAWPTQIKGDLLRRMRRLRMVQALSAGVDGLDFKSLASGVQVYSNAGAYTESVAEHAWGLLLGAAKGLHVRKKRIVPVKLGGGTLLVVGCGAIGSEIARLGRSIGMKTIGVSRSFKHPGVFNERHSVGNLKVAIREADAVAIALPLTKETTRLVDYEMLMLSKDAVILVNVGRGDVVSEKGLIRWLRERPESRYTTDVFWKRSGKETFDTKAWNLPNFSGTLHHSGTPLGERLEGPLAEAAKNVRRYLKTGEARNMVRVTEYLPSESLP